MNEEADRRTTECSTREYEQIPGTIVFDGKRAAQGYRLNRMCMSLNDAENRAEFMADASIYMSRFSLSPAERRAVEERDWLGMLELGANIFYAFKIAIIDGLTMQHVAASMCQMDIDAYRAMLSEGGRKPDG